MSVFAMADLHLSSDGEKSMEIFGARWKDYIQKIQKNWSAVVTQDDTVIIPGDISWSLKLEDTVDDLRFLDSLPGKKLIGKGNHDFWWSTASKMKAFFKEHKIASIDLLYNNAHLLENMIVCGSRGWFLEESQQKTVGEVDYGRILSRELIRLRLSLDQARSLQKESGEELPIVVFLHFPPIWKDDVCRPIVDLLLEYGVRKCYFGHIHGAYAAPRSTVFEGVEMVYCAADFLNFTPIPVFCD